jgi:hypothetical protein
MNHQVAAIWLDGIGFKVKKLEAGDQTALWQPGHNLSGGKKDGAWRYAKHHDAGTTTHTRGSRAVM